MAGDLAGVATARETVRDSCDDALTASGIWMLKTGVVMRPGPWKTLQDLEWGTMRRVDRCTALRLLSSIGGMPPAEAERRRVEQAEPASGVARGDDRSALR